MTKKDYELIADVLVKSANNNDIDGLWNITTHFIQALQAKNPAFNEKTFVNYINDNLTAETLRRVGEGQAL